MKTKHKTKEFKKGKTKQNKGLGFFFFLKKQLSSVERPTFQTENAKCYQTGVVLIHSASVS